MKINSTRFKVVVPNALNQFLKMFVSSIKNTGKDVFLVKPKLAIALIVFLGCALKTSAQPLSLNFGADCTLKSGTDKAEGAIYLYKSVNETLDCIVTIADIYGDAKLYSFDNNTITGNGGYGGTVKRFQPIISVPKAKNCTSYVKFHFQLIKTGSYNSSTKTGVNVTPSHMLWLRAYDIDGNGDNSGLKEFVETGNSFVGAWTDESTILSSAAATMTGGKRFAVSTSTTNGNNISDTKTLAFNAFLYPNTTGAWDVIGGSTIGSNIPGVSSGFDDGDRLNSWDFTSTYVSPGADFGDMPVVYEGLPTTANPAYHLVSNTAANVDVYLGTNKPDVDLDPIGSAAANTDDANVADNGLSSTSFSPYVSGDFKVTIKAYNSSGSTASIYGYIDFNNDGVFQANEKSNKATIAGNAGSASVTLTFPSGFTYTRTTNSKYARFRIGTTDGEVSKANGMAIDGEVEDYLITFNAVLPVTDLKLSANQQNSLVKLTLIAKGEEKVARYVWQQSADGANFNEIGTSPYQPNTAASNTYTFTNSPINLNNVYYRVVEYDVDGSTTISNVVVVKLNDKTNQITVTPTLITDLTNIKVQSTIAENLILHIINSEGKMVMAKNVPISAGSSTFAIDGFSKLSNGTYYIQVIKSDGQSTLKIVVQH